MHFCKCNVIGVQIITICEIYVGVYIFAVISISDGSSGHIFTTAIAVVCAGVEFSSTMVAVTIFRCLTTTVAIVGCDEYEN